MNESAIIRTLRCDFVRNATIGNRLIQQDSFRADVAYYVAGFHISTALFNQSVNAVGSWLVFSDAPYLEFVNSSAIRVLGSQNLVRSSALGVNTFAHKSDWVTLDPMLPLLSGQSLGLYAFASTLNTQRNFTTIALALIPAP